MTLICSPMLFKHKVHCGSVTHLNAVNIVLISQSYSTTLIGRAPVWLLVETIFLLNLISFTDDKHFWVRNLTDKWKHWWGWAKYNAVQNIITILLEQHTIKHLKHQAKTKHRTNKQKKIASLKWHLFTCNARSQRNRLIAKICCFPAEGSTLIFYARIIRRGWLSPSQGLSLFIPSLVIEYSFSFKS